MKHKLKDVRLVISPLTGHAIIGVPSKKEGLFKDKWDITNDFLHAVVSRWNGFKETLVAGDKVYQIHVKELKNKPSNE